MTEKPLTILMFDKNKDAIDSFRYFAKSDNYQLLNTTDM